VLSTGNAIDLVTYVSSGDYYISTATKSKAVTVLQNGDVGVNQTSPTSTFEVAGDTRTTTLRVDNAGTGPTPTPGIGNPITEIGPNPGTYLTDATIWLTINIGGTDYVIPAY
jgi:hypothetical protein